MGVADEIQDIQYGGRVAELELALERTRARLNAKSSALRAAAKKLTEVEQSLSLSEAFFTANPNPPTWLTPKGRLKAGKMTVCTMLSDCHLDEVVKSREVNGLNAYSREIAEGRLRTYFDKLITVPGDHGFDFDGIVVFMGGDMVSGDIHEELRETNEDTLLGTCLHWSEQIAAGINLLAAEYPKVHVASVCGNHGRRTRKERAKLRARDSFDWLLAHMARRAITAKNVTWDIPEETDARVQVHGTRYLLTHGNLGFGGGGGGITTGIWPTLIRGDLNRRKREGYAGAPYDVLLIGHYHVYRTGGEFIVNGSLKGVDEYAYSRSFGLEAPMQALWFESPRHGPFGHTPIFVAPMLPGGRVDAEAEGW